MQPLKLQFIYIFYNGCFFQQHSRIRICNGASVKVKRLSIFLSFFSILGIVSISFFLWLLVYQNNLFLSEIKTNEKNIIKIGSNVFEHSVGSRLDDALILSDIAEGLYDETNKQFDLTELENIFYAVAKNINAYDKIRLIDLSGQEIVKVIRNNNTFRIVPDELLKNNSHRAFFKQALASQKNVALSHFNLSIENNSIAQPHKPVLRIISLVHDLQGNTIGLVVLSHLGNVIFDALKALTLGKLGKIFLINDAGYYLLTPDAEQAWGFQLPEREAYVFANAYPKAWAAMQSQDQGSILTDNGLFTFKALRISSMAATAHHVGTTVGAKESWKLITFVPAKRLTPPWRTQTLATGVGILGLLLVVSWLWAGAYARRLLATSALKKSEQQLKIITDTAQDAIILLNGQGKPIRWNPAAERLFGYRLADEQETFFHDLVCPEKLQGQAREAYARFAHTGEGPIVNTLREVTALRSDGSTVPVELGVAAMNQGKEWLAVGVARDITERKAYEASLYYEQEFLKAVLEHIQEGILVSDTRQRIVLSNKGARDLFGLGIPEYHHDDWIAALKKDYEIFSADGTLLTDEAVPLQRILRGEHLRSEEIVLVSESGEKRTLIVGGRLLFDLDGRKIGAVLSIKDVTDLVNARESARSAERVKSALLSRVGHEFKTPLNGILGMTELLLEDPLTADQKDFVTEIKQSGNRLLHVLSMLIEYLTIESGERHLHFQLIPLDLLVQGIEARWRNKIEQRGLVFEISSNTSPLPTIHLDPDCANMILDLLLENAVKFTQKGCITAKITVEKSDASPESVCISIIDTGIGVKPEDRDRIFDEFWQEDMSYTRRYQGLGMGLTLVHGLIRLMGGRIWIGDREQGFEVNVKLSPLSCSL